MAIFRAHCHTLLAGRVGVAHDRTGGTRLEALLLELPWTMFHEFLPLI